jgi:hypothetical protein
VSSGGLLLLSLALLPVRALAMSLALDLSRIDGATGSPDVVFVVPFPRMILHKDALVSLQDSVGRAVDAQYSAVLKWPNHGGGDYLRALLVRVPQSSTEGQLHIRWEDAVDGAGNIRTTTRLDTPPTHHAEVTAPWLAQSYHVPMNAAPYEVATDWHVSSMVKYGLFVVEKENINSGKVRLSDKAAWLYDRVAAIYALYFKTGDIRWKVAAHESAQIYVDQVGDDGFFSKAPSDQKYVNAQGLLIDYLFYPSAKTRQAIHRMFLASETWPSEVKRSGFWTERHHAMSLSNAIAMWELELDYGAIERVEEMLHGLESAILASGEGRCAVHTLTAHEGRKGGENVRVCSPWMSAMLIEQAWRIYNHLHDSRSALVLTSLGSFIESKGLYRQTLQSKSYLLPKYLASVDGVMDEEPDPWSDIHHACDTAYALAKYAYVKQLREQLGEATRQAVKDLGVSCRRAMQGSRTGPVWEIKPVRKFSWWLNGSESYTWLQVALGLLR